LAEAIRGNVGPGTFQAYRAIIDHIGRAPERAEARQAERHAARLCRQLGGFIILDGFAASRVTILAFEGAARLFIWHLAVRLRCRLTVNQGSWC